MDLNPPEDRPQAASQEPFERELAELMVSALQLEIEPGDIHPTEPLFGEGLGLDSIDTLEIALAISTRYGCELKSDDVRNAEIFASLGSLSKFVAQNRTR